MVEDQFTVFILGAGASKPYGFPTAEELKKDICDNYLNSYIRKLETAIVDDNDLISARSIVRTQIGNYIRHFNNSGEISIDNFLTRYEDMPEFKYIIEHGKTSIFLSMINYESNSPIRKSVNNIKEDWYGWLYRKMRPLRDINQFQNNQVAFITFNYDRSLEHYFYTSLSNSFAFVDKKIIDKQLNFIPFIHVYEKLGALVQEGNNYLAFGGMYNFYKMLKLKENIKTIHERTIEKNAKIDEILKKAQRVFILGFGFAPENVQFLNLTQHLKDKVYNVYISSYNQTKEKMNMILRDAGFKDWKFNIREGSCLKVLEENL